MKKKRKNINTQAKPFFSICMPAYNGEKIITEALRSILLQDYKNFELIISDDCSTDGTGEVIKKISDERIKYYRNQKNLGYPKNIQACYERAGGKILFLMAQDDILGKGVLQRVKEVFDKNPEVGALTRPYFQFFDQDITQPIRVWEGLNSDKDEIVSINDRSEKIIAIFRTLDQLSGLAYRREWIKLPFHEDVFPCHVYPFASIFKKHPVICLKDFIVAVRISSSQTRKISSIYSKSPVLTWARMFETVFPEKEYKRVRNDCLNNFVAKNYYGLVQIRNFSTLRNLVREIYYLVKYRPQNLLSLSFWLFSIGCLVMPPIILIPLVDRYKKYFFSGKFKRIDFTY